MTQNRIASTPAQPTVPPILLSWLTVFRPCFTAPVWNHILVLVGGAVLAPGKRTVTQALRVMGLADRPGFGRYHEVLNRARWDARDVARRLLLHLLAVLSPSGEVVIGIDDTVERRWGSKIKARGIYRDAVRSSHGHFVKTSGLRWLSLAVMLPVPFAGQRWALPFLTVLAPSARWSEAQGRRHKALTDWARQAILQTKRWLPDRRLVVVADSGFSALELIAAVRRYVCLITRLRLDASLFEPAPKRRKGQMGRPALKGKRRPKLNAVLADPKTVWTSVTLTEWYGGQTRKLEYVSQTAVWYHNGMPPAAIRWVLVRDPSGQRDAQAFLCSDLDLKPTAILQRFVYRWRIETTFQEVREHLGVETQRQWSDLAILRTTPALLGLYSLVTVWAHGLMRQPSTVVRPHPAAWYHKHQPTFSDAIAAVRRVLWSPPSFSMSRSGSESIEILVALLNRSMETLASPPEMRKVELSVRPEALWVFRVSYPWGLEPIESYVIRSGHRFLRCLMWTTENRPRYNRDKLRYPSDLTDEEWALARPLIPPARRGGRQRAVDERNVLNGIMYVLSTGCQWRYVPKDLPPRSTLHDDLQRWDYDGTLVKIHYALYQKCREQMDREASPTACVIDSQSVKSAEKGGAHIDPNGYDAGKKIKGKKRHILVDTQGLLLHAVVHPADVQERDGGILVLATLFGLYPFLKNLFADGGYQGPQFRQELATVLPELCVEIIKRSDTAKGFLLTHFPQPFF